MLQPNSWFPYDTTSTQWALIGILAFAEFSRTALVVALLPSYVTGPLGASLTLVGLAISAHYLMDTLFRSPGGWLVDRIGPQLTLLGGLVIELVALLFLMHVRTPTGVVLSMGLFGVGTAAHWPAVVTGTNRLTALTHRGTMMGTVFAAWLAGAGIGPVLINFVVGSSGSDALAFLILLGADLAALGLVLALTDRRLLDYVSPRRGLNFAGLRYIWPLRAVLPGMFVQTMVLGELLPVLEPLTHRVLHLSQWAFAALLLGSGAITVILLIPMGRMADRLGLKIPLVVGFWMAAGAIAGLSVIREFWALVGVGGLLGVSYALILPSWNAFLARLIPPEEEGLLWGVFMSVEGLGMAVGPVIGARLFQLSIIAPFALAALVLTMMGMFYWFYPTPEKRLV